MYTKYDTHLRLYEYSQALINKLINKYKLENPALTDFIINDYIQRFDKFKNKLNPEDRDISKYSFSELEKLVDSKFPKKISKDEINVDFTNEAIYNENGLTIFEGDTKEKCIRYGRGEDWCISRRDVSNMFNTYRFRYDEINFYFVFDSEKNDEFSKIVILVDKDGNYYLANRSNDGDFAGTKEYSWNDIVDFQPKLKDLQSLFKSMPLTELEKEEYNLIKNQIVDDLFNYFIKYDLVEKYISYGHKLNDVQFINIPKELKNKYINLGQELSTEQLNSLDKSQINRVINLGGYITQDFFYKLDVNQINEYLIAIVKKNHRYLDLSHLRTLPNNIKFPNTIEYDLYLSNLTSLPSNVKFPDMIGGHLYLSNLTSLPNNIQFPDKIGGYLYLDSLEKLPEDFFINNPNLKRKVYLKNNVSV